MIDWSKAPEWAKYSAMDEDGEWYWFQTVPRQYGSVWACQGKSQYIGNFETDWRYSLTKRPKE